MRPVLSCFSHVWLCDPMDCSPPGSSIHRILQARVLEWVAISFSRTRVDSSYFSKLSQLFLCMWCFSLFSIFNLPCWIVKISHYLQFNTVSSLKTVPNPAVSSLPDLCLTHRLVYASHRIFETMTSHLMDTGLPSFYLSSYDNPSPNTWDTESNKKKISGIFALLISSSNICSSLLSDITREPRMFTFAIYHLALPK